MLEWMKELLDWVARVAGLLAETSGGNVSREATEIKRRAEIGRRWIDSDNDGIPDWDDPDPFTKQTEVPDDESPVRAALPAEWVECLGRRRPRDTDDDVREPIG